MIDTFCSFSTFKPFPKFSPHFLSLQIQRRHQKLFRVRPDNDNAVFVHAGSCGREIVVPMQVMIFHGIIAPPENSSTVGVDAEHAALLSAVVVAHEKEPPAP